jgi:hypothetical protein
MDQRVQTKVVDLICGLIARNIVVHVHVRDILQVLELSEIWLTHLCDMMSLLHYVVSALNLIHRLRDVSHSTSFGSSFDDDAHDPSLHDSLPSSPPLGRLTSPPPPSPPLY